MLESSLSPGAGVDKSLGRSGECDGRDFFSGEAGRWEEEGLHISRGPKPWEMHYSHWPSPIKNTFRDKFIKKFQDRHHRALKPQVWAPFWTWVPVWHVHEVSPENNWTDVKFLSSQLKLHFDYQEIGLRWTKWNLFPVLVRPTQTVQSIYPYMKLMVKG